MRVWSRVGKRSWSLFADYASVSIGKAAGETEIVVEAAPQAETRVVDLLAALEASVAEAKAARKRHPTAKQAAAAGDGAADEADADADPDAEPAVVAPRARRRKSA